MARIRTIKPEFFTSMDVSRMTPWARLLFIGLWTHSDDEGRNLNEPLLIKAALFPLDQELGPDEVAALMSELAGHGVIDLYHDESGRAFYQVRGWKDHQRIDRPKPSKWPSSNDHGCVVDSSSIDRGCVVLERKGEDRSDDDASVIVDALNAYVMSVCLEARNTSQRYRDTVHDNAVRERVPVLREALKRNPESTADDMRVLLGLERLEPATPKVEQVSDRDPNCEHCAGSGWRTIDFDRNTVGPCDCTPTIATVTELRTA